MFLFLAQTGMHFSYRVELSPVLNIKPNLSPKSKAGRLSLLKSESFCLRSFQLFAQVFGWALSPDNSFRVDAKVSPTLRGGREGWGTLICLVGGWAIGR